MTKKTTLTELTTATILGIFFYILIFGLLIGNTLTLSYIITQPYYQTITTIYQQNPTIKTISQQCQTNNTIQEAKCINDYIKKEFNYQLPKKIGTIKTPEQIITKGGYCQEYSILYATILKNLNWTTQFITTPQHIYIIACKNQICCEFDQNLTTTCKK